MSEIAEWLQGLDTPPASPQQPQGTYSHKRRFPLDEMDPNAQTPTKRARTQGSAKRILLGGGDISQETPRPPQKPLLTHPLLSNNDGHSTKLSYSSTSQSSQAITGSQVSLKRKRSLSPSKGLAQLTTLPYPVRQEIIGMMKNMPEPLRALTKTMRSIEKGRGIIPEQSAHELRPQIAEVDDPDDWAGVISSTRTNYGGIPDMVFAEKIVDSTVQNIRLGRSEAAWNCNVHFPLLNEACERSTQPEMVRCENITTAAIQDGSAGSSRKADFAITLALQHSTVVTLARRGIRTLSHSAYQPLCYSPPAVSIETKLEGEHGQEAGLQLSVWAHAHARSLRELLCKAGHPNVDIPALPLLIVQGGKWYFSYFEIRLDSAVRWGQVTVGDTATIRGVYQVFAAVQRLIEWILVVYRPWFVENIVTPLSSLP